MSKSPKKSKSLTRAGNRPATISAQQTIPYVRMLPDGICQLPGGVYTKTLEYEDINYSVASAEDQTAIFGGWSSWLNYFDSSLPFQLSFVNRRSRSGSRYKVNISEADDRFNSVRTEYTGMLKNQIAKSNNGIERAKYVTFCIPAENVAAARPRLERVEADVIGNFRRTFMDQERNPNKNAELSMEQNYNQIDGIINNLPAPPPAEKPLDKVREHPPKRRSREREER